MTSSWEGSYMESEPSDELVFLVCGMGGTIGWLFFGSLDSFPPGNLDRPFSVYVHDRVSY